MVLKMRSITSNRWAERAIPSACRRQENALARPPPGLAATLARTCLYSPSRSQRSNMRSAMASRRASIGTTSPEVEGAVDLAATYASIALAAHRRPRQLPTSQQSSLLSISWIANSQMTVSTYSPSVGPPSPVCPTSKSFPAPRANERASSRFPRW